MIVFIPALLMLKLLLSYVVLLMTQHLTGSETRSMSFIIKVLK